MSPANPFHLPPARREERHRWRQRKKEGRRGEGGNEEHFHSIHRRHSSSAAPLFPCQVVKVYSLTLLLLPAGKSSFPLPKQSWLEPRGRGYAFVGAGGRSLARHGSSTRFFFQSVSKGMCMQAGAMRTSRAAVTRFVTARGPHSD